MKRDKWIEALLKLRRNHADEIKLFHKDESITLKELIQRHHLEFATLTHPLDQAMAIRSQLDSLKKLTLDRELRRRAIENRHSGELYNLLQSKLMAEIVE